MPIVVGHGLMGALNCRAGFLAESARPPSAAPIADYVERLVAPYFEAACAWYETVGIGVSGGVDLRGRDVRLGDPFFGIGLNPGHLIHLDEWVHSPIARTARMKLASGMALQCDIIPATGTDYFTSNIEDGIALADEALRERSRRRYPEAWAPHHQAPRLHDGHTRHTPPAQRCCRSAISPPGSRPSGSHPARPWQ